ncbi:MAG: hypothetical protein M1816_003793 [Peltula sp. TS41687]|nr:MAG: hypothetical protein M1816_003793 [Peltula sp. TS41687]
MWVTSATLLAMVAVAVVESAFISALDACPATCGSTGNDPAKWTMYSGVGRLVSCDHVMLLDFAVYNPLYDPETNVKLFACTADDKQHTKREELTSDSCQATGKTEVTMELARSGSGDSGNSSQVIAAAKQIQNRLVDDTNCKMTISFGCSDEAVVGLYVGGRIHNKGAAESLVQKFIDHIQQAGISNSTLLQYCNADADYVLGIIANTNGNLAAVQKAVQDWGDAKCVTGYEDLTEWANTPLAVSGTIFQSSNTSNMTSVARRLHARATCSSIKVVSGDSCGSLASKCGITGDQFTQYNPKSDLCGTLAVGQAVCCSMGTLPDLTPKPNADGYCASYLVVSGDYCAKIAAENDLTVDKLESFNANTWGWAGCNNLMVGIRMCLSTGNPPMPAEVSNAVCGPQVPETHKPTDGTKLADLNPCKLNACCSIWGQCGTTAEFCTVSKSSTGAPGTAAPGENGCISNCGTDIVNNQSPPEHFMSVAYFEAWNDNRPCLNMDVSNIDKSKYTHIHFAFAGITNDFKVDVSAVQNQFDAFTSMSGIKRILSFGGWSFSTEQDTYPIFREGVTDANREAFATTVANFITSHNLDGVDFDWEYPGAPDIPGIPPGGKNDGANYLKFLKMVRSALPSDKTLSIAAPASFWYLQGFHPVKDFEPVLNYMIYMTYDLHGQWDYSNKWATPGCPNGNCLRSHVNLTETTNALSMVTKAGMPANKVIVGVSSYGRSFKMMQGGCTGVMCTFVGPDSAAAKGRCTGTAGYISNAEINEIIDNNPSATKMYDAGADSNLLVYDSTEWVAYMDDKTKESRTNFYKTLNLGGTSDWAVDLQSMVTVPDLPDYKPCDGRYDSLDAISKDIGNIPEYCVNVYIIQVQSKEFNAALEKYQDLLNHDYDKKFSTYERYVRESVPEQIDAYMTAHADDHWSCTKEIQVTCCSDCTSAFGCSKGCENCPKGQSGHQNRTTDCPNSIPQPGFGSIPDTIYWELKDRDAFFADLMNKYSIDSSWIYFGPVRSVWVNGGCQADVPSCHVYWHGYPIDKQDIAVPNPKEVISSALSKLTDFRDMLADAAADAAALLYGGQTSDVTTSSELPVFMTEFAVQSMEKVVEAAKEIKAAEKKEMILGFVMAFLMLIPAVGSAADAVGLAAIGRIIALTGDLGNVALGVYGVVEDPKSAAIALFGALLSIRGEPGFAKAAEIRRGMSAQENAALGSFFQDKSRLLDSIQRSCI